MALFERRPESIRTKRYQEQRQQARQHSQATRFVPTQKGMRGDSFVTSIAEAAKRDRLPIIGTTILIGAAFIYIAFFDSHFALTNVQVSDTQFLKKENVQLAVADALAYKKLRLLPQNRLLTLNSSTVEHSIRKSLGDPYAIESISIQRRYPNQLTVSIKERIPEVLWVTKEGANGAAVEHLYTVDRNGFVTQQLPNTEATNAQMPRITDLNREVLGVGWQVVGAEYVSAMIGIREALDKEDIPVQEFVFPAMTCREQEYVAEKIFADEIASATNDAFKDQKREIQEQFRRGDIDIDESLRLLEEIKQEERSQQISSGRTAAPQRIEWAQVDKEIACDYVTVASDITVVATEEWSGVEMKFDTRRSIDEQVAQLREGLQTGKLPERAGMQYIDLRVADRIYYR